MNIDIRTNEQTGTIEVYVGRPSNLLGRFCVSTNTCVVWQVTGSMITENNLIHRQLVPRLDLDSSDLDKFIKVLEDYHSIYVRDSAEFLRKKLRR